MSKYFVFIVAATALLLANMTITAVAVAFPSMVTELHTSIVWVGWALTVYQIVLIGLMPIVGKASDAFGRKRVFAISMVLFCVGSLAAGFAPTIHLLIAARVVQAAGGAGFLPSAAGIISDVYPETRAKMIGLFSSVMPIGVIIGPNVGGLLVESFGWRSVFWLPIPLGLILLALAAKVFPYQPPKGKPKLDLEGAALLAGGITLILLALSELGGKASSASLGLLVVFAVLGLAFLARFVWRERHTEDPMVDLRLLQSRPFLAANTFNFLFGACLMSVVSLIPLYAVSVYGLSTLASGFVLTPRSIAVIIASAGTSLVLKRWGYRQPMIVGAVILATTFIILGTETQQVNLGGFILGGSALLMVVLFFMGTGVGIANPAGNNACIELMPDRVASIVGLRGMFRNSGGAFGIAMSTLILHWSGSLETGFRIFYFVFAALMLATIPVIFMVPSGKSGNTAPARGHA